MKKGFAAAIAVIVFASGAVAQFSGYAEVLGGDATRVQLNLYERFGTGAEFPDTSVLQEVRAGAQNGPVVWEAVYSGDLPVTVGPYAQATGTWDLVDSNEGSVPDGAYFLMVRSRQLIEGAPLVEQWFPVTVALRSVVPTLTGNPTIAAGVPQAFALSSPIHAGVPYVVAASFSTQSGFDLLGGYLHAALDMDGLFFDSLENRDGGPYSQFQGALDAAGQASFSYTLPATLPPSVQHLNIHVQALIFDSSGAHVLPPVLTNVSSAVLLLPQG